MARRFWCLNFYAGGWGQVTIEYIQFFHYDAKLLHVPKSIGDGLLMNDHLRGEKSD